MNHEWNHEIREWNHEKHERHEKDRNPLSGRYMNHEWTRIIVVEANSQYLPYLLSFWFL